MMSTSPEEEPCKVGKHSWTPDEDAKLTAAVQKYGACRWSMIATQVGTGRVGKQCRERWNNHLCPDVKKSEWSESEDLAILNGVAEMGTRWCEIVQCPTLAGRTDNAIKNRFYALQRRSKAAHSVAVRAAGVQQVASPLGKRTASEARGFGDVPPPSDEAADDMRNKVMGLATAIACAADEAERDRLIGLLTATLHPRAAKDSAAASPGALRQSMHQALPRRPSPLAPSRAPDGEGAPCSPDSVSGSPLGRAYETAPSFRSDSSSDEDSGDEDLVELGERLADTIHAHASEREGGGMAATGTEEPGAAAPAACSPPVDTLGCLGGRHRHRALLAPLSIPEATGVTISEATATALFSAHQASPQCGGGGDEDTPSKKMRTPRSGGGATTTPPWRAWHARSPSALATGTEETGATVHTSSGFGGAAASPLCGSPSLHGAPSTPLLQLPSTPVEAAPSPLSQLQLSCFTDLFADAPLSTGAQPRGKSPFPLVSSPLAPSDPWRTTSYAPLSALVG